ncbi:MAG: hypothetical protein ACTSVB_00655 [Candidatus Heimdallarchaeaceae archaeon]
MVGYSFGPAEKVFVFEEGRLKELEGVRMGIKIIDRNSPLIKFYRELIEIVPSMDSGILALPQYTDKYKLMFFSDNVNREKMQQVALKIPKGMEVYVSEAGMWEIRVQDPLLDLLNDFSKQGNVADMQYRLDHKIEDMQRKIIESVECILVDPPMHPIHHLPEIGLKLKNDISNLLYYSLE